MELVATFCGSRDLSGEEEAYLHRRLAREIEALVAIGAVYFCLRGEWGFDLLAAREILAAKERHPHIRLIVVRAWATQGKSLPPKAREAYKAMCEGAYKVITLQREYVPGCIARQGEYLLARSQFLICYVTRAQSSEGTLQKEADRRGLILLDLKKGRGA